MDTQGGQQSTRSAGAYVQTEMVEHPVHEEEPPASYGWLQVAIVVVIVGGLIAIGMSFYH